MNMSLFILFKIFIVQNIWFGVCCLMFVMDEE